MIPTTVPHEIDHTRLAELQTITLSKGAHGQDDDGYCVMEFVAYVAGEDWTDEPACCCPVIAAFCRAWNDGLPSDAERDRLLAPLIPTLVGTRSTPGVESQRSWMALDWLVRTHAPAWLVLVHDLRAHGVALQGLPEITDSATAGAASTLDAARAAARVAARDAAGATARAAAWAAAGAAAGAAAWAAAGAAAWAAAGAAAWAAAGAAARDAARDAARAAAGAAAGDALSETTSQLQESAVDLVRRMVAVTDADVVTNEGGAL